MNTFNAIRFAIYVYAGIQFIILFYIYMKGWELKPSKFPLFLSLIFACVSILYFLLAFLVIVKAFDPIFNREISWIFIVPVIPQVIFAHFFIKESLPNKK